MLCINGVIVHALLWPLVVVNVMVKTTPVDAEGLDPVVMPTVKLESYPFTYLHVGLVPAPVPNDKLEQLRAPPSDTLPPATGQFVPSARQIAFVPTVEPAAAFITPLLLT